MSKTLEQILTDAAKHNTALAAHPETMSHVEAWELAKRKCHVSDVRNLTRQGFKDLIELAEQIRRGLTDVSKL